MAGAKNPVSVGPKSDKPWRHAIRLAVNRLSKDGKTKHLDILAHRLIRAAADGDVSAMREIGDRLDGKPTQGIDLAPTADGLEALLDRIGKASRGA